MKPENSVWSRNHAHHSRVGIVLLACSTTHSLSIDMATQSASIESLSGEFPVHLLRIHLPACSVYISINFKRHCRIHSLYCVCVCVYFSVFNVSDFDGWSTLVGSSVRSIFIISVSLRCCHWFDYDWFYIFQRVPQCLPHAKKATIKWLCIYSYLCGCLWLMLLGWYA